MQQLRWVAAEQLAKKLRLKSSKSKFDIKINNFRGKMTEEDRIGLLNEIDILKQVDHPNIVKLIDVYEDSQTFSLVLELMTGGELFETILEKSSFSEQEAKELILPIVDAIKYCHSLGIVHRDIKPENLLFSSKDPSVAVIKVSDFGRARTIEEDQFA